jgi:hypothetical protein
MRNEAGDSSARTFKKNKGQNMNINQINKLKMGQTTLACLNAPANQNYWQGIVGIQEAATKAGDIVAAIIGESQKQAARNGFAAEKQAARAAMLRTAFTVCSGLTALAAATGNSQLAAQTDFSRSALAKGREQDVVNRCQSLSDLGDANKVALAAKYNVSADDIEALDTAIIEFVGSQAKPRNGRAISAAATKRLEALFAELDETLNNQLDPLLEKFASAQPAFHASYRTARSIVDSAASHAAEKATVTSIPAPLPKAA